MSLPNNNLLESIKIQNRKILNLSYHEQRISHSLASLFGRSKKIDFSNIQKQVDKLSPSIYKLRIVYNQNFLSYTIDPYTMKPIQTLKKVMANKVDYSFKFEDRRQLDKLLLLKRHFDDILIIKNDLVTDTHYCNVAFFKEGTWFTPSSPLLEGTKRQQLLEENRIVAVSISQNDIRSYKKIRLFNAMIDFGELEISTANIF